MICRPARRFVLAMCCLTTVLSACQPSRSTVRLVPHLYSVTVLPAAGGGTHTIDPGGTITIQVEVIMGVAVSGEFIQTRFAESSLPTGVTLDPDQLFFIDLPNLAASESDVVTYDLVASATATPGSYQVTINASADITAEGESDSDNFDESTTFTLVVAGAETDNSNGGSTGPTGPTSSSCEQFVAHYNALPCTTESLTVEGSCSASIAESCDEDALNACRIENTFCDGDQLIQNIDSCFDSCN